MRYPQLRAIVAVIALAAALITPTVISARQPKITASKPHLQPQRVSLRSGFAVPDTAVLGAFDFEGGGGLPDAQGWTTYDASQEGVFFHIDNFLSVSGSYVPLAGTQSLWCGVADGVFCHYATAPGYGTAWDQRFTSVPFTASTNASLSFKIEYDVEPGYDFVHVEYRAQSGAWRETISYTGKDSIVALVSAPDDSVGATIQWRFRMSSDGAWNDEDGMWDTEGACVIDDIIVFDDGAPRDAQDFETAASGALTTADGDWTASGPPIFGDFAGLFDGSTVLQQDSVITNNTHLWGFFNGSPDTYDCGGHPEQASVPFKHLVGGEAAFIHNEIWSPQFDLSVDANSMPVAINASLQVVFDVYADLPQDNLVFYEWKVRFLVGSCWQSWESDVPVFYSESPVWLTRTVELIELIPAGATHMQVALGAVDLCSIWCGTIGTGACHSHAPLFDNVRIMAVEPDPVVVINTNDSGVGSLRDAIDQANALSGIAKRIHFNIPGPTPHTISLLSALPNVFKDVTIDGTTQPGYAGTPVVEIDGLDTFSSGLLLWDDTAVYGLAITRMTNGIQVNGDNVTIQNCLIGTDAALSSTKGNSIHGIFVSSGKFVTIGGPGLFDSNIIAYNSGGGVAVSTSGNIGRTITYNQIYDNDDLGIDLFPLGPNANDPLDVDGIGLQNYPVLTLANASNETVEGYLNSTPNKDFTIQLFKNTACDVSGYGEGETYMNEVAVTTDAAGYANFTVNTSLGPASFMTGDFVTATATRADGNTSEFSLCMEAVVAIVVTNVNDAGAGSLRDAIDQANLSSDLSIINFNIAGAGPHAIAPLTRLPRIMQPVVIDGYSQPGSVPNTGGVGAAINMTLRIALDGSSLPVSLANYCLRISGGGSTVRGLNIRNFPSTGLLFDTVGGNSVHGCYIGVGISGTTVRGNNDGILIDRISNNMIGGTSAAARNVVSGNNWEGIRIAGPGADNNLVQGNHVGLGRGGSGAVRNLLRGIIITSGSNNEIGGSTTGAGNIVGGNGQGGIHVLNADSDGNIIHGNYVGTNRTGAVMLSNTGAAMRVNLATNTMIGGSGPGEGNILSGSINNMGVLISSAPNTKVYGNNIGTDITGTVAMPNDNGGISISGSGALNTKVGGPNPGEGNLIAFNDDDGVRVSSSTGNLIRGNSIHSNNGLDIDIDPNNVTPNDAGDGDVGANNIQNYATVSNPVTAATSLAVDIQLNSTPSTSFVVEVFASQQCNVLVARGGGEVSLGTVNISTDGAGNANQSFVLPMGATPGWVATATTTGPGGNTSEFSPCVVIINTPTGGNVVVEPVDEEGDTPVMMTFDTVSGGGTTTLITSDTGPVLPGAFSVGDGVFYELNTTASFDSVEICIEYDEDSLMVDEKTLVLWHYVDPPGAWEDVTTSHDIVNNIICGKSATLSPFAMGGLPIGTGIDPQTPAPSQFALHQNVPNPFNPTTTISYQVPTGGAHVNVTIYDVAGRVVRVLVDEFRAAGRQRAVWDGRNRYGQQAATGVYFYRMQAADFTQTKKMVMLK